ncbi:MAG: hypothetical protein HGA72_07435 [Chlorobiaceae bacterium]|nr:hypothetical protein [Chlorobiaceae bacterium]HWR00812.1 hypothetical protein [Chlorobaculum sp.]
MDTLSTLFTNHYDLIFWVIVSVIAVALFLVKRESNLKIRKQVENLKVWIPETEDNLSYLVGNSAGLSHRESNRSAA